MKNVSDMDIEIIYGDSIEKCNFFWTTFTDRYSEGKFVDELTNETINEIMWHRAQPAGGRRQNDVGFRPKYKSFNDLIWDYLACVSCEVHRTTKFTMRGVCKWSFLETKYFPTICNEYIGFIGDTISIW